MYIYLEYCNVLHAIDGTAYFWVLLKLGSKGWSFCALIGRCVADVPSKLLSKGKQSQRGGKTNYFT